MRVGIACLHHATNTFAPNPTTRDDFAAGLFAAGPELLDRAADAPPEVAGFLDGLKDAGHEAVPLLAARAAPGGTIDPRAAGGLVKRLLTQLRDAGPLDGLLVAATGAAAADGEWDFDGCWVGHLRRAVGPRVPIYGVLGAAANLSRRLHASADVWLGGRTLPSTDGRDRGRDAARLLARHFRGELRPTGAAAFLPFVPGVFRRDPTSDPAKEVWEAADAVRRLPAVLSVAPFFGSPFADVPHLGASVAVVTNGMPGTALAYATAVAQEWWDGRARFRAPPPTPAEAVAAALDGPSPALLLDAGDDPAAGAPGDGTELLRELAGQNAGPALAILRDGEVVDKSRIAGVGATLTAEVGAKSSEARFRSDFRIAAIDDAGTLLESDGPNPLTLFVTCGAPDAASVDVAPYRVVAWKGATPPAAWAGRFARTLAVGTRGATAPDFAANDYTRRRRPMDPWEPGTAWEAGAVPVRGEG